MTNLIFDVFNHLAYLKNVLWYLSPSDVLLRLPLQRSSETQQAAAIRLCLQPEHHSSRQSVMKTIGLLDHLKDVD